MLLGIFFLCFGWFSAAEIELVRAQYLAAALDKDQMGNLEKSCAEFESHSDGTVQGYCSMIHFLEAKHAFNPYKKLNEFNLGKKTLDSLILKNSANIELRYLRHSIQDRVPGFLGYHEDLAEDETYMRTNLGSISDSSTYQLIYKYLQNGNDK